jgi:putative ABC transport system permease protein
MLISQNFRTAFRGLTANKLRSALTILGIVIGVAAVVALMAIGNGATSSITSRIESNGTNLITIMTARFRPNAGTPAQFSYLTLDDYQALKSGLSNVAAIAPSYQSNYDVKQGSESLRVSVTGVTEDYFKVNSANEVELGRMITAKDRSAKNRVAVIGSQTADDLFQGLNPVNKVIKINGVNFTIIGVLKEQDSAGFTNSNDVILIPLETGYAKLFGANAVYDGMKVVNTIAISAASADAVDSVMSQAESILRAQHDLLPTEDSDFTISSQSQILDTLSSVTTTLTVFLGAIAGISLLVGGIGIMNIMLVSVTERTREIGLRKAVGARKDHILFQFLVETITLSVLGGVIGILLGAAIAAVFTALGLITAVVSLSSILMSFFFAVAIGLFFGLYPAFRAANLHPMEALRYE